MRIIRNDRACGDVVVVIGVDGGDEVMQLIQEGVAAFVFLQGPHLDGSLEVWELAREAKELQGRLVAPVLGCVHDTPPDCFPAQLNQGGAPKGAALTLVMLLGFLPRDLWS